MTSLNASLKNDLNNIKKIPIIVDTDIGGDIDDVWALTLLLMSPEFDIKLITTAVGDTLTRAKIVAKMLISANRTDIPIGIGLPQVDMPCYYGSWAEDFDLDSYEGTVYEDGIRSIVDAVMESDEQITVLALAPLTNLAATIDIEPKVAEKSILVGMLGSIYKGYHEKTEPDKECNIVNNIPAAKKIFNSSWDMTITPLDTCGSIRLTDSKYEMVASQKNLLIRDLIETYDCWLKRPGYPKNLYGQPSDIDCQSSILFDTVAVYLAMSQNLLHMEKIGLEVTDDGYTKVNKNAKKVLCATKWNDIDAFENFLVKRLCRKNKERFAGTQTQCFYNTSN